MEPLMANPRRRKSDLTSPAPDTGTFGEPEPAGIDNIRHRAFELYEARGRESGHELDDWLAAEREMLTRDDHVRG